MNKKLINFKEWLQNEARFDPEILTPHLIKYNDMKRLEYEINLTIDNEGNIIQAGWQPPYLTINQKKQSVSLVGMSPQSTAFRRIINAIKSKYADIESWKVIRSRLIGKSIGLDRTVGYWLSRPEIRLSNKTPKYLYHGTSTNLWYEGIKQKGLVPRNLTGTSGSYGSQTINLLSHENLVYLTTDPDIIAKEAAIQAALKWGGKALILKIDTTGLDSNRFKPDEDSNVETAQKSIDVSSAFAYQGKIPANNLQPFLLEEPNDRKWVKFHDVPIEEHPITTALREKKWISNDDTAYYPLIDAGIIDARRNLLIDPENISDQEIKNIIKKAYWVTSFRLIMQDLKSGPRGTLYQLQHGLYPHEILENPIIKMLVDSKLFFVHEVQGQLSFKQNDWEQEQNSITLAKMLGKKSFNYLKDKVQQVTNH